MGPIFGSLLVGLNGNVFVVAIVVCMSGVTLDNLTIDVWVAFILTSLTYNQKQREKSYGVFMR